MQGAPRVEDSCLRLRQARTTSMEFKSFVESVGPSLALPNHPIGMARAVTGVPMQSSGYAISSMPLQPLLARAQTVPYAAVPHAKGVFAVRHADTIHHTNGQLGSTSSLEAPRLVSLRRAISSQSSNALTPSPSPVNIQHWQVVGQRMANVFGDASVCSSPSVIGASYYGSPRVTPAFGSVFGGAASPDSAYYGSAGPVVSPASTDTGGTTRRIGNIFQSYDSPFFPSRLPPQDLPAP